jgi:hypothetical protein
MLMPHWNREVWKMLFKSLGISKMRTLCNNKV